jgi:hypothetical protein
MTPIACFAKTAVNEVRNSIFGRMSDVQRIGGSKFYQKSIKNNVDRRMNSMNVFMGKDFLTELLVMGTAGIYVDAPDLDGSVTLLDEQEPYIYMYRVEDILSWVAEDRDSKGQFKAVLLRDKTYSYDQNLYSIGIEMPNGTETRYRLIYRDDVDQVRVKMFSSSEEVIFLPNSEADGSVILDIPVIPFIMPTIGDSLLKEASSYQVALLNLASGSVNFDMMSNVPLLTIQTDLRTAGSHLKKGLKSPESGSHESENQKENVGGRKGRYYDKDMDRPDYISPSSEPLIASMQLQQNLKDDIRRFVYLSVEGKAGSRTESGEAKKLSSQSLEAGLSFIGSVLESAEQQIATIWAYYENTAKPEVAKVSYPRTYSLKTDTERIEEASKLIEIADKMPSNFAKRQVYKHVADLLIGNQVSSEQLARIHSDIDEAKVTRCDLEFIIEARKEGLVSDETASESLGFAKGEVKKAADDHAARLQRILQSQSTAVGQQGPGAVKNPASRGVPELDDDTDSGKEEQKKNED